VTLLCSPKDMKYLVAGFLVSEGLLNNKEQIKKIESGRMGRHRAGGDRQQHRNG